MSRSHIGYILVYPIPTEMSSKLMSLFLIFKFIFIRFKAWIFAPEGGKKDY